MYYCQQFNCLHVVPFLLLNTRQTLVLEDVMLELPSQEFLIQTHAELIVAMVFALDKPEMQQELAALLQEMAEQGWGDLAGAIHHIWQGERNLTELAQGLTEEQILIVQAIIDSIAYPETLALFVNALEDSELIKNQQFILQTHIHLIIVVILATLQPKLQSRLMPVLNDFLQTKWQALADAIHALWQGERDTDILAENLDTRSALIIHTILQAIEDDDNLLALLVGFMHDTEASITESAIIQPQSLALTVSAAIVYPNLRDELEYYLEEISLQGQHQLVTAIYCLLDGERDADVLQMDLTETEQDIIQTILDHLEDPEQSEAFSIGGLTLH